MPLFDHTFSSPELPPTSLDHDEPVRGCRLRQGRWQGPSWRWAEPSAGSAQGSQQATLRGLRVTALASACCASTAPLPCAKAEPVDEEERLSGGLGKPSQRKGKTTQTSTGFSSSFGQAGRRSEEVVPTQVSNPRNRFTASQASVDLFEPCLNAVTSQGQAPSTSQSPGSRPCRIVGGQPQHASHGRRSFMQGSREPPPSMIHLSKDIIFRRNGSQIPVKSY